MRSFEHGADACRRHEVARGGLRGTRLGTPTLRNPQPPLLQVPPGATRELCAREGEPFYGGRFVKRAFVPSQVRDSLCLLQQLPCVALPLPPAPACMAAASWPSASRAIPRARFIHPHPTPTCLHRDQARVRALAQAQVCVPLDSRLHASACCCRH